MLVIFLTHFYRQRKVLAELPRQGPHLSIKIVIIGSCRLILHLVMTCSVFVLTIQIERLAVYEKLKDICQVLKGALEYTTGSIGFNNLSFSCG